ncbi:OsmC family protein [Jeotgalibacillus marinus]|uniref:Uncharacterized protein n=1 Tax=Jeotgalibacillus marinus TaxID=86667 RepID=A0ABV3Q4K3_9BACL
MLVSSVAVCSGGVLRAVFEKMRLKFEDIEVNAKFERNEAIANRTEKIHVFFLQLRQIK